MKALSLGICLCLSCAICIQGQVSYISHSIVAIDQAAPGFTTYQIFANLQDADDILVSVYSSDDDYLVLGSQNEQVFNQDQGSITGDLLTTAFCMFNPTLCFDSFVTVGWVGSDFYDGSFIECGNPVDYSSTLPSDTSFEESFQGAGLTPNLTITEGSWSSIPGESCNNNGLGIGMDNAVLIAQITIDSNDELLYNLNTLVFDGGDPESPVYQVGDCHYVNGDDLDGSGIGFHFPTDPSCAPCIPGCTDSTAVNFDPTAVCDDGSCFYVPSNDLCENAMPLPTDGSLTNVTNYLATPDGPVGLSWADNSVDNDVWFTFEAPSSGGILRIETWNDGSGSLTDTQLAVYDACGGLLIHDDEDLGQMFHACVIFSCVAGTSLVGGETYFVQLDGNGAQWGTCDISITLYDNPGCTDSQALNFEECATIEDGNCVYPEILGCTATDACNFNPLANIEDMSCCYDNCIFLEVGGGDYDSEISWALVDSNDDIVMQGGSNDNAPVTLCGLNDCYTFIMYDAFGDSWNGAQYTFINADGLVLATGTHTNGLSSSVSIGLPTACGCTDPTAYNYNEEAGIDDGTCLYSAANDGCGDALPIEFFGQPIPVNNLGATPDGGVGASWIDASVENDVWFSFIAPSNGGAIVIETSDDGTGTFNDTQIALYDGCSGTILSDDDDGGVSLYSLIDYDCNEGNVLVQGQTYLIQIDGYNGDEGTCLLTVSFIEVEGCTDPEAMDFDPCATTPWWDCDFGIVGCTDSSACNFDSLATLDDGSCVFPPCFDGSNVVQLGSAAMDINLERQSNTFAGDNKNLNSMGIAREISVYPNPNEGQVLYMRITGVEEDYLETTIVDSYGKVVLSNRQMLEDENAEIVLPLPQIEPGIYFVISSSSNFNELSRLVILK